MDELGARPHVSTAEVADALGVSISTVKRWVDDGILPAHKTAGGHRKLLLADVLEFTRRTNPAHNDLSRLMKPRRGRQPVPVSALADSLHQALVQGSQQAVRDAIHGGYHAGLAVETLADEVIGPAMRRIGHDWQTARIEVMHEHRATQLCGAALYELKAVLETRAVKNGPVAVGGGPERDPYFLANLLAQMVLLDAGWNAVNLGPNTPFASFSIAITELKPRLVWLSISHLENDKAFVEGYREFSRQLENADTAVAIGGQGLVESVRCQVAYTTHGDGLAQLAAFARMLHVRPRRPRRGRPPNQ